MLQKELSLPKGISYQFLRSKDTHEENGIVFITLFYRLTREFDEVIGERQSRKVETVWVEIEELKQQYASEIIQKTANEMQLYTVTEEMFQALHALAIKNPRHLYLLTPLYQTVKHQWLIPRFPSKT